MKFPETPKKSFYIQFQKDWWNKGDLLTTGKTTVIVTKVYRNTWWRKILRKLGMKVRICQVKVKSHETI